MLKITVLICLLLAAPFLLALSASGFDAKRIEENGSKDSLHIAFHRQNLTRRALWLAVPAVLNGYLVWPDLTLVFIIISSYTIYCAGVFGYFFTIWLNLKRGLQRWYISKDPKAANTDKAIVTWAEILELSPFTFASWLYPILLALGCFQYLLTLYLIFLN